MSEILHATKPYGRYLQTYFQDEVTQAGDRFLVSHVRYRQDGKALAEIERQRDPGDGHALLAEAIDAAEAHRSQYLDTEAEEMAGAAEEIRARDYAYETRRPELPRTSGCNTWIEYFYRDANNSKQYGVIVVAGVLSEQEIGDLESALPYGCFIPEHVGMEPLQAKLQALGEGDDDAWHEIDSISVTEEPATFPGTAQELLARFKAADWKPSGLDLGQDALPTP